MKDYLNKRKEERKEGRIVSFEFKSKVAKRKEEVDLIFFLFKIDREIEIWFWFVLREWKDWWVLMRRREGEEFKRKNEAQIAKFRQDKKTTSRKQTW